MNRFLKTAVSLAAILVCAPAFAADLPANNSGYDQNFVTPAVYDWTGFYVGGHLGYGFGDASGVSTSGFVMGGHAGFNVQQSSLVLGMEGDFDWANISDSATGVDRSIDYLASIRARAGIAYDQYLFYGTGGFSFGGFSAGDAGFEDDNFGLGWVAGVGAEVALAKNWTARIEAFYYDLGEETYALGTATSIDMTSTVIRAGVSYKF